MIQRLQEKRNNQDGFTLVELLVVIVILGILASIVVFAVGGITDKGDEKAKAADVSVLQTAEEAYYANANGGDYATEQQLVDAKFLRSISSKHDICVQPPVAPATTNADYAVVNDGQTCAAAGHAGWVK